MASTWDHERDNQLLVAILAVHAPLDFAAIAQAMGQGDSTAAVRQHVYTLKVRHEGSSGKSPTKDKANKPTGHGRKATKSSIKRKSAPLTKSESNSVIEGQDGDGDDFIPSPTKQRKI
ncbi:WW/Rsp5/WWP [Penicillium digitatum]|uniref:AT hook motif protein n=3 Tax=Penicillium digitatum TaxID=36651 RepID=K9G1I1_PEND2|nr:hypothetical protein PDIP_63240 [Penicillium digitatum Pd1]EKV09830.1 hypothetical protein PDIP_63240 [Penicillium digitatum Pd1]EKV15199.1 hypothetical protein PDIG_28800 [Penicillium digitatum PHI26]KAG0157166.1 hypothetical protein PDIDSM_4351 [Penicillium digitatum]QQK44509.1 WW/Rsp5/WWP [Penicillium digitatum]